MQTRAHICTRARAYLTKSVAWVNHDEHKLFANYSELLVIDCKAKAFLAEAFFAGGHKLNAPGLFASSVSSKVILAVALAAILKRIDSK